MAGDWIKVEKATARKPEVLRLADLLQVHPDVTTVTRYAADGTELSDSARYRMLGNAVTKSVAYWIGRRIVAAHNESEA